MSVTITQDMISGAIAAQEKYGVPASITLGQIILESSGNNPGGLSGLAYKAKNLFGIKAGNSWRGKTYSAKTGEYGSGGYYNTTSAFRAYDSFAESIDDHGKLLASPHYQKYLKGVTNYKEYAKGIKAAGYATDPNYASKLISIIESNGFQKYDTGKTGTATTTTDENEADSGGGESQAAAGVDNLGVGKKALVLLFCLVFVVLGFLFLMGSFNLTPIQGGNKN